MITGKDLILYILQNNLEDKEIFNSDNKFAFLMDENEAAAELHVGVATIRVMYQMGMLKGFKIGDSIILLRNGISPVRNTD